jgi:NADH-quinone oxidoreductase subunit L
LEKPLGGIYTLLRNKYYVDEFYQWAFIRPARWLAETLTDRWLDRTMIDGALHSIAGFGVWLGKSLRRWIDLPVINGAGDLTAAGTRNLGAFLRSLQSGRVQIYATVGLGLAAMVAILIYFLWVVG